METPLERVLRLAAVRSYTRMEHGRPQQVRQYVNRKGAVPGQSPSLPQAQVAVAPPAAGRYGQAGQKQGATRRVAAAQLRPGHVIHAGGSEYTVVRPAVASPGALRSLGRDVHTGGAPNTSSPGPGVNTAGPGPQAALTGGAPVPPGVPSQVTELRDNRTGKRWFVHLPAGLAVPVAA